MQFHRWEHRFRQQVDNALVSVKRILDTTRNPRLAEEEQDHDYEDKFALAALLTNTALVAQMTALTHLGVTSEHLDTIADWVHNDKEIVTMRFSAIRTCTFLRQKEVPFVLKAGGTTHTIETERSGRLFGKTKEKHSTMLFARKTTMLNEYHWTARVHYQLRIFAGASPDGENAKSITLQSRDVSTILIVTGTEQIPLDNEDQHPPIDANMTWFFQQIAPGKKICRFVIDRSNPEKCRTPRRNEQIDQAVEAFRHIQHFANALKTFMFHKIEREILGRHSPVLECAAPKHYLNKITSNGLFNPVLPFFEKQSSTRKGGPAPDTTLVMLSTVDDQTSPLLSLADMDKFLGEQIRTIDEELHILGETFPDAQATPTSLVTTAEAKLVLMCRHLVQLVDQYRGSLEYIEAMLKQQLVTAIGKEVQANDFEQFMRFYNHSKLFREPYVPQPFCFAIRRPGHYPDGILSLEEVNSSDTLEPVETFVRKIITTESSRPIRVPLNAATTLQLTGDRYLHGWMRHRFSSRAPKEYCIGARARQFSCFLVMIGTIAGPERLDPKHAIILQNKDELLIPLLLEELPTAKEFKDAISSLSPEQKDFAKQFREMQLESSVFGICVVQLKPQLEDLLGLPPGGLIKEMKLTQDLLTLFMEYQIPSDLLSYDGLEEVEKAKKLAQVKEYTKSVMDVIQSEKESELREEQERAALAKAEAEALKSEVNMPIEYGMLELYDALYDESFVDESFVSNKKPNHTIGRPSRAVTKNQLTGSIKSIHGAAFKGLSDVSPYSESRKPMAPNAENDAVDFTTIPKQLDKKFESYTSDSSVRVTIIKTAEREWKRHRQTGLLKKPAPSSLGSAEKRTEKDKAFDLLDALSRSGSLPLRYSEIHVIVAATHSFENDVMHTVIQDNINPIEKVERSSLLMASTIHGQAPNMLLQDSDHVERLKHSFPASFV